MQITKLQSHEFHFSIKLSRHGNAMPMRCCPDLMAYQVPSLIIIICCRRVRREFSRAVGNSRMPTANKIQNITTRLDEYFKSHVYLHDLDVLLILSQRNCPKNCVKLCLGGCSLCLALIFILFVLGSLA